MDKPSYGHQEFIDHPDKKQDAVNAAKNPSAVSDEKPRSAVTDVADYPCTRCNGTGTSLEGTDVYYSTTCPHCGGSGRVALPESPAQGGELKIERLVLSIATNQFTTESLPSGKDIVTAINERDALLKVRDAAQELFYLMARDASGHWCFSSLSRDASLWDTDIERLAAALAATNSGDEPTLKQG